MCVCACSELRVTIAFICGVPTSFLQHELQTPRYKCKMLPTKELLAPQHVAHAQSRLLMGVVLP